MRRLAVLAASLIACSPRHTASEVDASAAASASSSAASIVAPDPPRGRIPRRSVREGSLGDRTWVGAFDFELTPGGEGASFLGAITRCREDQRALCTESEWQRACAEDPSIGRRATWTATGDEARGFVIRGGGTCESRAVAPPAETSPSRGVACCTRALALRTQRIAPAVASKKLLAFETAVNERRSNVLSGLFEDHVNYYGHKGEERGAMMKRFEGDWKSMVDLYNVFDLCDVASDSARDEWQADCKRIVVGRGQLAFVVLRLVFGGESEKIRDVVEPVVFRKFSEP